MSMLAVCILTQQGTTASIANMDQHTYINILDTLWILRNLLNKYAGKGTSQDSTITTGHVTYKNSMKSWTIYENNNGIYISTLNLTAKVTLAKLKLIKN